MPILTADIKISGILPHLLPRFIAGLAGFNKRSRPQVSCAVQGP